MLTNNKIKIGLWGCGKRTNVIIKQAVASSEVEIVACYDINEATARANAEKFEAEVVTSAAELLNNPEIDALVICLYPGLHAAALKQAIPSGKPIYIEKPVASNLDDLQDLIKLEAEFKPLIHVGLIHRYIPIFKTLTELVKVGKIGRLIGVQLNWLTHLEDIEMFPGKRDDWHFREDTGGELIQHFCHAFDWLRQLGSEFSSITAMNNHLVDRSIPIEDNWDMLLRYDNDALLNFHSSMRNARNSEIGWIEGDRGSLEWEWSEPSYIKFYKKNNEKCAGVPISVASFDMDDTTANAFSSFLRCVQSGKQPEITLRDGMWSVLIPLMAREAATSGQTLSLKNIIN